MLCLQTDLDDFHRVDHRNSFGHTSGKTSYMMQKKEKKKKKKKEEKDIGQPSILSVVFLAR